MIREPLLLFVWWTAAALSVNGSVIDQNYVSFAALLGAIGVTAWVVWRAATAKQRLCQIEDRQDKTDKRIERIEKENRECKIELVKLVAKQGAQE